MNELATLSFERKRGNEFHIGFIQDLYSAFSVAVSSILPPFDSPVFIHIFLVLLLLFFLSAFRIRWLTPPPLFMPMLFNVSLSLFMFLSHYPFCSLMARDCFFFYLSSFSSSTI